MRRIRGALYCSACISKLPKKTCRECGDDFHVDRMNGPRCRPCASSRAHEKRVADTYGMKPGQYAELLEAQGGVCFICRRRPVSKRLAVDHDHSNGLTRGLLCRACNRDVLGHLKDSVAALYRAIDYLQNPPAARLWGDDRPKDPNHFA